MALKTLDRRVECGMYPERNEPFTEGATMTSRPLPSTKEGVKLYGVWGGRWPGGWCSLGHRMGHIGKLEEATTALDVFLKERADRAAKYGEREDTQYEVVVFDEHREPVADENAKATPSQLRMLAEIHKTGRFDSGTLPTGWRKNYKLLYDRGYVMFDPLLGRSRATVAGLRQLKGSNHELP
jgi:hypothetical protein